MTPKQRQAWDNRLNHNWARIADLREKAEQVPGIPRPTIRALARAEAALLNAEATFWVLTTEVGDDED